MSTPAPRSQPSTEDTLQLMGLVETTVMAQSFEELAASALPALADMTHASGALLYVANARLAAPRFLQHGLDPQAAAHIEGLCVEQFEVIACQVDEHAVSTVAPSLVLYPLRDEDRCVGLVGLVLQEGADTGSPVLWAHLLSLFAQTVSRLAERAKSERQLAYLNIYLTVSSALSQELGLHELLEIALYSCMEAVSAEAASVLLLDDEQKNLLFYQVEGPAKPILITATFPAEAGLAGSVLQTLQSEIINDVHGDPRFYEQIDSQSGFETRNMIVVPLVAGEEKVGALEVLNKMEGGDFMEEEQHLLLLVAEEIAFAIRNAMIFEYVVNSYCKQRQGLASCRGCQRPLRSWTPCVRYREASV